MSKKIDKKMTKSFHKEIYELMKLDSNRQIELITDEDAINFLKESPYYTYEIYKIQKELV